MKHPVSTILWVLSVGFLCWIAFFGPGMIWVGGTVKNLPVRVVRSSDRQPVAGARVLLLTRETFAQIWALDQPTRSEIISLAQGAKRSGLTDQQGRVTLRGLFPAGGRNSLLLRRGSYGIRGEIGVVTETTILTYTALETLLPDIRRSLGDELPEIELTIDQVQ